MSANDIPAYSPTDEGYRIELELFNQSHLLNWLPALQIYTMPRFRLMNHLSTSHRNELSRGLC